MSYATEAELLTALNSGETAAYDALYRCYYDKLVMYALRYLSDPELARDIVQDVLLATWERKVSYPSIAALKGYLYRGVHNACLNHLRDHNRLTSIELLPQEEVGEESPLYFVEEEIYLLLFRSIAHLSEGGQKVMLLSLDGLSNSEIAERLGIAVETVKTQKKRALRRLHSWRV